MMRVRRRLLKGVVCILLSSLVAVGYDVVQIVAQPFIRIASDDSYVNVDSPGTNYNHPNDGGLDIWINTTSPPTTARYIGYLGFDVSDVSSAGCESAVLTVYEQLGAGADVTVSVYRLPGEDDPWDEGTITASNAPAKGSVLDSETGEGHPRWWVFSSLALTDYVRDQLPTLAGDGQVTFVLEATGSGSSQFAWFEDHEDGEASGYPPRLGCYPTAVDLASFTATPQLGSVLVEWETVSEVDNLGFYVYRSDTARGERVRLNEELIPTQAPGSPEGARYELTDRAVMAGQIYYYWLVDVDVYGLETQHGPVLATVPASWRWLPIRRLISPLRWPRR